MGGIGGGKRGHRRRSLFSSLLLAQQRDRQTGRPTDSSQGYTHHALGCWYSGEGKASIPTRPL